MSAFADLVTSQQTLVTSVQSYLAHSWPDLDLGRGCGRSAADRRPLPVGRAQNAAAAARSRRSAALSCNHTCVTEAGGPGAPPAASRRTVQPVSGTMVATSYRPARRRCPGSSIEVRVYSSHGVDVVPGIHSREMLPASRPLSPRALMRPCCRAWGSARRLQDLPEPARTSGKRQPCVAMITAVLPCRRNGR